MTRNPHTPLDPVSEQAKADDVERRWRDYQDELDRDRYWVEGFHDPELSKRLSELASKREKAA